MSNESARSPIRVRLRFNIDNGDTEFIVDDLSPDRSEAYHNKIANAIASFLMRNPEIRDAGPIRYRIGQEWYALNDGGYSGRLTGSVGEDTLGSTPRPEQG